MRAKPFTTQHMRAIFWAPLLCALILAGAVSHAQTYTTRQLTNNARDDESPQINRAGQVVWSGFDGQDWEIYLYNGKTTINLSNNAIDDYTPQINDAGQVVWWSGEWVREEDTWERVEIYLYNGKTTLQLTDNDTEEWRPQINASGQVVWYGFDGEDFEIYLYSGSLPALQLTDNDRDDTAPEINNAGQVVWTGGEGRDWEIYLYDGKSTVRLSDNHSGDYYWWFPQINAAGQVVWDGWSKSQQIHTLRVALGQPASFGLNA